MEISRCYGCMSETRTYPCPDCGYTPETIKLPDYVLRQGTILNGKYLVGKVLGQGGFGITYVGWDLALERKVAIKEYFPSGQVSRSSGTGSTLQWYDTVQSNAARQGGMEMFLKEARKMSRVDSVEQVVRVQDVFRENDTAYIVMDFVEGETLKMRLAQTGPMSWEEAKKTFLPAIHSMSEVHKEGLIHRDISPDNLMLEPGGRVRILDLGAAKDLKVNSGASSMMVAKGGFSPLEQYTQRGGSGTWTDVYAMAATMYYALTGVLLPTAVDRMEKDAIRWDLPNLQALPQNVVQAMQQALIVLPQKRTQTMEKFENQLTSTGSEHPFKIKYLLAIFLLVLAGTVTASLALAGRDAGDDAGSESLSTVGNQDYRAPVVAPGEDWEAEVDAVIAAGTQDIYTYQNGAKLELYFDGDYEAARVFTDENGTVEYVFKACYDDGNLLEERGYDSEGTLMCRTVLTRNADGNVLEGARYGQGGKQLEKWLIDYDDKGREMGYTHFDNAFRRDRWSTTAYDAAGEGVEKMEGLDGRTSVNRYDAEGNRIEYCSYDTNGRQEYRGTSRYDDEGHEIEWCSYDENNTLSYKCVYSYDGDRKVRETSYSYYDGEETIITSEVLLGPHDVEIGRKTEKDYSSISEDVTSILGKKMRSFDNYSDQFYRGTNVTYYDWNGKCLNMVGYDENGDVNSETVYHYDAYGSETGRTFTYYSGYNNTTIVTEYDADNNQLSRKTYDASGKLIESE